MKNYFYFLAFFLYSFCCKAQVDLGFNPGFEKSFVSKTLGEQRKVWIHIPSSHAKNKTAGNRYPVIYLLDGQSNFNSVVSVTEFMSDAGLCPEMIVVGILHPNRMTDLTFGTDKDYPGLIGKGEGFLKYIANELMPYITLNYPSAPYNIIVGHSVGGLTVMHALMHQPHLFEAYISLDGALWWDNEKIVREAKSILETNNYKGKTLFMALANHMEKGVDTLTVQKDTSENTVLIRANLELVKDIFKNPSNQLRFKHRFYENDDHGSVRLIGEYDAMRFIFDYYKLNIYNSQLDNPSFKLDSLIAAHYSNVSAQLGYLVKPSESQVNNLGYFMLGQKQFDKAAALFNLNIASYPNTANCYDGMGDLYLAKGDTIKAAAFFKKTLDLKEIPETRLKLNTLLKAKL